MLLTITTTHYPASDLGYLLHKHPSKVQQVDLSVGAAHIYYTEVSEDRCTAALLLDIDPVGLVRRNNGPVGNDFALQQYVNDRPYVASSFMSAAIAKAFSSAMNGRCKDKPELVTVPMPFDITIAVLPVRGGENLLRQLFEPLGYFVQCERHLLDPAFPQWGESRYFTVRLSHKITLQQLLSHLYVLIPVCDNDKHYWVGQHEVEKLLEKGKEWLSAHPMKELITVRYLKHQKSLSNKALEILLQEEVVDGEEEEITVPKQVVRAHDIRLKIVAEELKHLGSKRVVDLGCGEGKLLRLLMQEKQFENILGVDVSYRSLEIARDKLKLDRLPSRQQQRIQLVQGALTYRDQRIEGFEAAVLVEVIEHLDEPRLAALERVVFEFAKPQHIIITTPNADYNVKFPDYVEGQMRHSDHRFEWTRDQFKAWGNRLSRAYNYSVVYKSIGEEDPEVGALSQMAVFSKNEAK
jgi:3' terminal RNA ribose 2'-O-methyltransferase Hen1